MYRWEAAAYVDLEVSLFSVLYRDIFAELMSSGIADLWMDWYVFPFDSEIIGADIRFRYPVGHSHVLVGSATDICTAAASDKDP